MKKSKNYVLRSLGDEYFLIPRGKMAEEVNGVLTLSETAAFIYKHIEETESVEEIVKLLSAEFHATKEEEAEMKQDVQEMLQFFQEHGITAEKTR